MNRPRWGVCLSSVVVLCTCAAAAHAGEQFEKFATVEHTASLDSDVTSFKLKTSVGRIAVTHSPDDMLHIRAEVRVHKRRAKSATDLKAFDDHVHFEQKGDVLQIVDAHLETDQQDDWHISLEVATPRPLGIDAVSGVGEIVITCSGGDLNTVTGVGRIEVSVDHIAALTANSGTGKIEVTAQQLTGPVTLASGVGEVIMKLKGTGTQGDLTLTTGTGDVRLELPAESNGVVEAETGIGNITARGCSGVSVQKAFLGASAGGRLGDGGPDIKLSTGTGAITLRCR